MTSIPHVAPSPRMSRRLTGAFGASGVIALVAACSSSSSPTTTTDVQGVTCSPEGSAASGPADTHCIVNGVPFVQATGACETTVPDADLGGDDADAAGDAASGDDGGGDAGNNGTCGESSYSATMYGMSGSDDCCKYDVSWTSTPLCENGNVYFTVTARKRAGLDGGPSLGDELPLTGAMVVAEVYYHDCMHPAPNASQTTSTELGNGVYRVGPIVFDEKGLWVVRFHFNPQCTDLVANSPHGHAAFWMNLP